MIVDSENVLVKRVGTGKAAPKLHNLSPASENHKLFGKDSFISVKLPPLEAT